MPDRAGPFRLRPATIPAAAAILLGLAATPALAHAWYDARCCSGRDCHPVPCQTLRLGAAGDVTFLPTGLHVFRENVLPSRDDRCHICTSRPQTDTGYAYCAYLPVGVEGS